MKTLLVFLVLLVAQVTVMADECSRAEGVIIRFKECPSPPTATQVRAFDKHGRRYKTNFSATTDALSDPLFRHEFSPQAFYMTSDRAKRCVRGRGVMVNERCHAEYFMECVPHAYQVTVHPAVSYEVRREIASDNGPLVCEDIHAAPGLNYSSSEKVMLSLFTRSKTRQDDKVILVTLDAIELRNQSYIFSRGQLLQMLEREKQKPRPSGDLSQNAIDLFKLRRAGLESAPATITFNVRAVQ